MKRAAILTCILLILCGSSVYLAASNMYEEHDKVYYTEKVLYGDRKMADGLQIDFRSTYKYHLLWDTTHVLGENGKTETTSEYNFSTFSHYEGNGEVEYKGVNMDTSPAMETYYNHHVGAGALFAEEGLDKAYQELADTVEAGQEGEKTIYLKDYVEYYPLEIRLELPGNNISTRDYFDENAVETYAKEHGVHIVAKLWEYFKIPVLEEETVHIHLRKDKKGNVINHGSSTTENDAFYMYTYGETTDKACFFTFDTLSKNGTIMDTSHLKEGYGIYTFSYEMKDVYSDMHLVAAPDADSFRLFYPLEPGIQIAGIKTNEKQDRILLHTVENGIYYLTVIDIATGEMVQKLEIAKWHEEWNGLEIYDKDDFMVMVLYGEKLAVVTLEENGEYKVQYVCNIREKELEPIQYEDGTIVEVVPWLNYWRADVDFDGEKLVMTGQIIDDEYGKGEDTVNFYVAVYTKEGLKYYGEYRSSLSTGIDSDKYNYHCRGTDYVPVKVKWLTHKQ